MNSILAPIISLVLPHYRLRLNPWRSPLRQFWIIPIQETSRT